MLTKNKKDTYAALNKDSTNTFDKINKQGQYNDLRHCKQLARKMDAVTIDRFYC